MASTAVTRSRSILRIISLCWLIASPIWSSHTAHEIKDPSDAPINASETLDLWRRASCSVNGIDYSQFARSTDYMDENHINPFYRYFANICADVNLNPSCGQGAMICEQLESQEVWTNSFVYGYTNQMTLQAGIGSIKAVATVIGEDHPGDGVDNFVTTINFKCDTLTSGAIDFIGEDYALGTLTLDFRSKNLCDLAPVPPGPNPSGGGGDDGGDDELDVGMVLCLCFFLPLLVYFIVGAVLLHRSGKTGTELVVHKTFWFAIPGLAKDGCRESWWRIRCWIARYNQTPEPERPTFQGNYQQI